jgi:predicted MPP superfamily phosphohydrolase
MYIPKIFASFFFFINDLVELIVHEFGVFLWMGIIIGILLLTLILYGIVYGKFHFKTEKKCLKFENLPNEFNGLRIVHFSDLHIGSWVGSELKLQEAVNLINAQNPDLILFTGDLINNFVEELDGFKSILKQLRAKYGIYSVLGNHDYGDYFDWNIEEERIQNLENLKKAHNDLGFHLLLNDSAILNKKHSKIGIVGVENWGLPPFHQNGDLQKALDTLSETSDFNILLSHDPSHWNQKVLKRDDIDLTLSGHTHGMQFGIYTRKLKWSPAKWKYPEWGGLYEKDKHKLYVSTGLGFIGFPGRIGVRPRITLLELRNTSN